ncbi:pantoate--beta-alanine ligase [Patulibacter sp.]|uniref:pantoate--beta-alanine ligase n=1 Tax=Patulibacter sp. TaxID=1912859 RepID=UPI0027170BBC|nr:pantoate--beta-alanine ligase [Patulibacter sp.]MDO9409543.1 pantoate--beta-alanine ligase [Patulibacter sp.]
MRIVRTTAELREHVRDVRASGGTVGLVPTMGALHAGHVSLIDAAVGRTSNTVVSLFVNPRQFGDASDLSAYPRTEEDDAARAQAAGADVLFAPDVDEVYPDGYASEVRVSGPLTERLEGAHRGPEHFHGVTTVVTKLLNMVAPDVAFFGAKDAQQVLVVRRLVRDLDLPVEIVALPTVREADGLALSSRNVRLSADDRARAVAIPRAIEAVVAALAGGEDDAAALLRVAAGPLADAGLAPEYVAIVDPATLAPRTTVDAPSLLALAVPVGPVRLIDNALLSPVTSDAPVPALSGAGWSDHRVPPTPEKG